MLVGEYGFLEYRDDGKDSFISAIAMFHILKDLCTVVTHEVLKIGLLDVTRVACFWVLVVHRVVIGGISQYRVRD